jgi:hypothetical protein
MRRPDLRAAFLIRRIQETHGLSARQIAQQIPNPRNGGRGIDPSTISQITRGRKPGVNLVGPLRDILEGRTPQQPAARTTREGRRAAVRSGVKRVAGGDVLRTRSERSVLRMLRRSDPNSRLLMDLRGSGITKDYQSRSQDNVHLFGGGDTTVGEFLGKLDNYSGSDAERLQAAVQDELIYADPMADIERVDGYTVKVYPD